MTAANFPQALKYVLIDEGGNDDDPDDSGGRTSRGITQREYDAWCRLHNSPSGDVWRATDVTVAAIYQQQYWQPYCDALWSGLDYLFFDIAVNAGPGRAAITLQRALGVTVDGHVGVVTMAAALAVTDKQAFLNKMNGTRKAFYEDLAQEHPKDEKFLRGWLNRVAHAQANSQALLTGVANA